MIVLANREYVTHQRKVRPYLNHLQDAFVSPGISLYFKPIPFVARGKEILRQPIICELFVQIYYLKSK